MIRKITVSRDESVYEAWPDVTMTRSGKLIAVFTECEHHLDRDKSRLVLKESRDKGETWGEKIYFTPLAEKKPGETFCYYNCARVGTLGGDRVYVLCDRIVGDEHNVAEAEIYLWISRDDGKTWDEPLKVPLCGIVPDKITELKSGRIIVAAHFRGKSGKLVQRLVYSDDGMKSWSEPVVVADDPRYNLCEVSILPCENVLVAFLRENSNMGCPILKTFSYDEGKTWSELYPTSMDSGHRPVSGFLRDGGVMVTYRYIPRGTQNVFAAFFDKTALTAKDRKDQRVRIMPLDYDRNPSPDLGYTGWVQFDDGEILVVNYIKDDADKAFIRAYKFKREDVVLPVTERTTRNVF